MVGGNLTRSPGPLVVDVTAVGEVRPRRSLTRSGGRPGDELYVSGTIGGAAAGLEMLRARRVGRRLGHRRGTQPIAASTGTGGRSRACGWAWRSAQARAARAAMDLSDGLADALRQLADASGCGVEIDADALPIDQRARDVVGRRAGRIAMPLRAHAAATTTSCSSPCRGHGADVCGTRVRASPIRR